MADIYVNAPDLLVGDLVVYENKVWEIAKIERVDENSPMIYDWGYDSVIVSICAPGESGGQSSEVGFWGGKGQMRLVKPREAR